MQSLFGFHETQEVVTNDVPELAENATDAQRVMHKEAKKKDCKAGYCIQSEVVLANFDMSSHAQSVKEAWDILVKYYEGGEKVKMGEDEKIADYVSKVKNLVHLMKDCGETLTDKKIVEKVMCTLTFHFDHVIVAIQESNNLETMKLKDLVGSVEAHEIRTIERKGVQDSIQALQDQAWKKHDSSNKFRGKEHKPDSKKSWLNPQKHEVDDRASESPKRRRGNSYQKDKEKKSVQLYKCEKWGHMAKNYWYNKDKGATKDKEDGLNLARQDSNDYEDMVVMDVVADDHVESKIWFLDSGCLNHMTGRKV
ncbi:uncharacterized protein LOC127080179 [Lathyrus oleraceus]|uniref:uncharacterized protein LOC127080179 n=1 Tax=Pisum sativum TaxID=3888 RepID=UPI0021D0326A|nr:uncharacterized protein LOC127080179 [Pisum sativum]